MKLPLLLLLGVTLAPTALFAQDNAPRRRAYTEDELRALAARYAPVIFQEVDRGTLTDPPRGREDFIAAVDYDGDLQANNNWDHLNDHPLLPVVYFSLSETATHYYISYAVYHPRDWSRVGGPYAEHENDMESVQVVVAKGAAPASGTLQLLLTQAHLDSAFAPASGAGVRGRGDVELGAPLIPCDARGRLSAQGTHPAIFIERKGHGIYSLGDRGKLRPRFAKQQLVSLKKNRGGSPLWEAFPIVQYIPAPGPQPRLREPTLKLKQRMPQQIETGVPYALVSVYHVFWRPLERGKLCGNGQLFDGSFSYRDGLFDLKKIPRHFDADKPSGPGKFDAGIAPFALGLSLSHSRLGEFFFNPARAYHRYFIFPGAPTNNVYSTAVKAYLYNPYLDSPLNGGRK